MRKPRADHPTARRSIAECRALLRSCAPDALDALLADFAADARSGVRALASARRKALARERLETDRLLWMTTRQRELHDRGFVLVAGIDEVGRGALAGPLTAAAVVLDLECVIGGLDDSKRLLPAKRRVLAEHIRSRARAFCVAHSTPAEIDGLGIGEAVRLAWRRAIEGLGIAVDHVLVDGNDDKTGRPSTAVVGGDATCACIAAASIVAKVERDSLMESLAGEHPGYGFDLNKGYGTREHLEAIALLGPSPIHRRSFSPCSQPHLF